MAGNLPVAEFPAQKKARIVMAKRNFAAGMVVGIICCSFWTLACSMESQAEAGGDRQPLQAQGTESTTTSFDVATLRISLDGSTRVEVTADSARTDLTGGDRTNPVAIAERMAQRLQFLVDEHILLSDLDDDDPDKTTDPGLPGLFWETIGGDVFLTGRPFNVDVTWNGSFYRVIISSL